MLSRKWSFALLTRKAVRSYPRLKPFLVSVMLLPVANDDLSAAQHDNTVFHCFVSRL
jgi:hypothetical protein